MHVEVRSPAAYALRRRGVHDLEACQGRRAWKVVERVLAHLWTGKLIADDDGGHVSITEPDGNVVCRLRSDEAMEFFRLSKHEAVACVELWHQLSGRVASLTVKDTNRCFDPIRRWQAELTRAFEHVTIRCAKVPRSPALATLAAESAPLTRADDLYELSRQTYGRIDDFRKQTTAAKSIHESWVGAATEFQRAVTDRESLVSWISAARGLCVDSLSLLPRSGSAPRTIPGGSSSDIAGDKMEYREEPAPKAFSGDVFKGDIFKLIQVLHDRFSERRNYRYNIERQFLEKCVKRGDVGGISTADQCQDIQTALLRCLNGRFERSLLEKGIGPDRWKESLITNALRIQVETRLEEAAKKFREGHAQCIWEDSKTPTFQVEATALLANVVPCLAHPLVLGTSKEIWKQLFDFGKQIADVTTELLECPQGQERAEAVERFLICLRNERAVFDILFQLRNRAAHPEDRRYLLAWIGTQKDVARRLGIAWNSNRQKLEEQFFGPEHLHLTALEGNELKAQLLEGACEGLRHFILLKS